MWHATRPGMHVVDRRSGWKAGRPPFDPALRSDGIHFSQTNTEVATWLGPKILWRSPPIALHEQRRAPARIESVRSPRPAGRGGAVGGRARDRARRGSGCRGTSPMSFRRAPGPRRRTPDCSSTTVRGTGRSPNTDTAIWVPKDCASSRCTRCSVAGSAGCSSATPRSPSSSSPRRHHCSSERSCIASCCSRPVMPPSRSGRHGSSPCSRRPWRWCSGTPNRSSCCSPSRCSSRCGSVDGGLPCRSGSRPG